MKRKCSVFFGFAVVLTAAIVTLAGCELDANPGTNTGTGTGGNTRYETVLYRPGGARAADEAPPYKLVASVSVPSTSSYFYRYYMGYVKSVPISYKTAYRYEGTTSITISWERSVLSESAVMNSMSKTTEHTWGASLTVTGGFEVTVGTGDSSPIKSEAKASVEVAVGGSYGGSIATESTYETTETFAEGQSESITATIGENDEAPGKYRYALFGSTDVYYEVEIDSNTREVKKAEIIQCARGETLAWGIDFTPLGQTTEFGKTGDGDNFEIPDIDFTTIAAPTKVAEEAPPAPVVTAWTGTKTDELRVNDSMYSAYLISRFYQDSFTSNFDFSRLQEEEYKTMTVKVDFQVKPIDEGWVNVYVFSGTMDRELDYTYEKIDPPQLQWSSQTYQFFVPLTSFTSNDLKILWTASGEGSDDYQLGVRTITVTASKE